MVLLPKCLSGFMLSLETEFLSPSLRCVPWVYTRSSHLHFGIRYRKHNTHKGTHTSSFCHTGATVLSKAGRNGHTQKQVLWELS